MKTLIYLLQVSACTGIFYSFYFLLLRRLTFFKLNRWYLLVTLMLSFVIPTLTITVNTAAPLPVLAPVVYVQHMQTVYEPVHLDPNSAHVASPFGWILIFKLLYLIIAVGSTAHLVLTVAVFMKRTGGKKLMAIGNVKVLKADKKFGNSSFLNVIFVNDDEMAPYEMQQIVAHELLHIKLLHSADRIIARLVQIVLWFNPFAYLYMRSIEENHEFEVDRIAARGDEKGLYAQLLFKLAVSGRSYLFHSFSRVPLKKRISMLFNKPTSNMKKVIYVLILPMVVLSCLAFANLRNSEKLSVVDDLHLLGPHPLVLVDGKVYDDDMLYKIGGACVLNINACNPTVAPALVKKYGNRAKDGVVTITTKNHHITYQTIIERKNLAKKAAIPKGQFYTRLSLLHEDGGAYDVAYVNVPNGGKMSSDMKTGGKVIFLVGGKALPESEIKAVEQIVRKYNPASYAVGPVKQDPHRIKADYSKYDVFFDFFIDTNKYVGKADMDKYQQRLKQTKLQKEAADLGKRKYELFKKSDEYKQKQVAMDKVSGKTSKFTVVGLVDFHTSVIGKIEAFKVKSGNNEYFLRSKYGQDETLNSKLQPGDVIEVKVESGLFAQGTPVIIQPEIVTKNGVKIFEITAKKPAYAFLYEANKVRFADGRLTNVQKYNNGKWKSAIVTANGYQITLKLKPSAPDFVNINLGDQVRFRFVHEMKTGDSTYSVNDWVALTNDVKDNYGVKNPDYFNKFYQKI